MAIINIAKTLQGFPSFCNRFNPYSTPIGGNDCRPTTMQTYEDKPYVTQTP